jgi:hypothetical protein
MLGCLLAGVVLWRLELFGASTDADSGALMNGLLIAAAPWVGAFWAYGPARLVALAPRGLATTPELGGTWLWVMWAVMLLAPAAEFAWGTRRLSEAIAVWLVVSATWLVVLEVQRRTRAPLADGAVANEPPQLLVNVEAFAVGVLWATAFALLAAFSPDAVESPLRYSAGAIALGTAVAYAAPTIALAAGGWIPAYPAGLFGLSILGAVQYAAAPSIVYLVTGTVVMVCALEPKRRSVLRNAAGP